MKKTKTFVAVEDILAKDLRGQTAVSPRDSDNELLLQYLHFHTELDVTPEMAAVFRGISFESITRARRKLQEQGKYWGSPEVMKRRRIKSYEVQQTAATESAAGLQRRIEENATD